MGVVGVECSVVMWVVSVLLMLVRKICSIGLVERLVVSSKTAAVVLLAITCVAAHRLLCFSAFSCDQLREPCGTAQVGCFCWMRTPD